MKTIAITIDEASLEKIQQLEEVEDRSRSEIVREALAIYLSERERRLEEQKETQIFRKHRRKLQEQATALIREQKGR